MLRRADQSFAGQPIAQVGSACGQGAEPLMRISRRLYVMGHGRIVFEGTPADIEVNADVRKEWLEV
jgi:hypothetical protein